MDKKKSEPTPQLIALMDRKFREALIWHETELKCDPLSFPDPPWEKLAELYKDDPVIVNITYSGY